MLFNARLVLYEINLQIHARKQRSEVVFHMFLVGYSFSRLWPVSSRGVRGLSMDKATAPQRNTQRKERKPQKGDPIPGSMCKLHAICGKPKAVAMYGFCGDECRQKKNSARSVSAALSQHSQRSQAGAGA